jgi:hypothetical protein
MQCTAETTSSAIHSARDVDCCLHAFPFKACELLAHLATGSQDASLQILSVSGQNSPLELSPAPCGLLCRCRCCRSATRPTLHASVTATVACARLLPTPGRPPAPPVDNSHHPGIVLIAEVLVLRLVSSAHGLAETQRRERPASTGSL